MTIQFEALPVGRGDAFLLRHKNGVNDQENVFLFDGGQYITQVTHFLRNRNISYLDAVICSHNDSDHANGIIGVLESDIQINEIWVPVNWLNFMETVKQMPYWQNNLTREFLEKDILLDQKYEDNNEKYFEDKKHENGSDITLIGDLVNRLTDVHFNEILYPTFLSCPTFTALCGYHRIIHIIEAGLRIISIIERAWNRGCKIRLFEHFHKNNSNSQKIGNTDFTALGCHEVTSFNKCRNVSSILYLTIQNIESLVFEYHVKNDNCRILFTSDSDLHFISNHFFSSSSDLLITAPHHGSEENADVYSKIKTNNSGNVIWVRSDSKNKKRPCKQYISQPMKYCTICNSALHPKKAVLFEWNNKSILHSNIPCTCK